MGSGHVAAAKVVTPLDGLKYRAELAGMRVIASASDNLVSAVWTANQADLAIVVAGTSSGESKDRDNLNFDNGADTLIEVVAQYSACRKLLVIALAPGAVLMPWKDLVSGIAIQFLGGSETGAAIADVLFGDHAPSGRLPLMIPATEADTILPGTDDEVVYTEGIATSYRNKDFKAAFPFGFGLSFSTFEFSALAASQCDESAAEGASTPLICVTVTVTNTGSRAARAVPQLYLELPAVAKWPVPILKGFQKTGVLLPKSSVEVIFKLKARDLSYFDPDVDDWVLATSGTAHIGESSADLPIKVSFDVPQGQTSPPRRLTAASSPPMLV